MRRDGHQVNVHRIDVHGDLADSLRGVRVEKHLFAPADGSNLLEGLDHANLVVDRHDAHQRRFGADGSPQPLKIHQPAVLHRQVGDVKALVLQMPAAVKDTLVLRLCGDDVLLLDLADRPTEEPGDALDAHVVALGGAAGEDDFLGVGADQRGNMLSGFLDGLFALPAVGVRARMGVSIVASVEGHHGVQDPGVKGCCGLHVEVDGPLSLVHLGGLLQDI